MKGKGIYTGTVLVTYKITPAELTVTTGSASKTYDGKALTNSDASLKELLGQDVGKATVTATGSQTAVGESTNNYDIDWGEVKSTNYTLNKQLGTLTVTQKSIVPKEDDENNDMEVIGPENVVYKGEKQELGPEVKDGDKTLTEGTDYTLDYGESDTTNVGTVTVTVTGTGNYSGTTDVTYEITPAPLTVTTGSATKTYDGKALTNAEATIDGLVNGEEATIVTTGSQTAVGSSQNTYEIAWEDERTTALEGNYEITEENFGTLTVNAVPAGNDPADPTPGTDPTDDPTPAADDPTDDTPTVDPADNAPIGDGIAPQAAAPAADDAAADDNH